MIWIFIALQFVLVSASMWRWTRVAQQSGYAAGSLATTKRELNAKGSRSRITFIVIVVFAVLGMVSPVLAFVAAAVWFQWPSQIPFRDREKPLVWDRAAQTYLVTAIGTLFICFAGLFLVTSVVGIYALSALPLLATTAGEWALRMSQKKTAA